MENALIVMIVIFGTANAVTEVSMLKGHKYMDGNKAKKISKIGDAIMLCFILTFKTDFEKSSYNLH